MLVCLTVMTQIKVYFIFMTVFYFVLTILLQGREKETKCFYLTAIGNGQSIHPSFLK